MELMKSLFAAMKLEFHYVTHPEFLRVANHSVLCTVSITNIFLSLVILLATSFFPHTHPNTASASSIFVFSLALLQLSTRQPILLISPLLLASFPLPINKISTKASTEHYLSPCTVPCLSSAPQLILVLPPGSSHFCLSYLTPSSHYH